MSKFEILDSDKLRQMNSWIPLYDTGIHLSGIHLFRHTTDIPALPGSDSVVATSMKTHEDITTVKQQSCGTLCNLVCDYVNTRRIEETGGIETLVPVIKEHEVSVIQEQTYAVMRKIIKPVTKKIGLFLSLLVHSSSWFQFMYLFMCIICPSDTWWRSTFDRFPVHHSFIVTTNTPDSRPLLFDWKETDKRMSQNGSGAFCLGCCVCVSVCVWHPLCVCVCVRWNNEWSHHTHKTNRGLCLSDTCWVSIFTVSWVCILIVTVFPLCRLFCRRTITKCLLLSDKTRGKQKTYV